MEGGIAQSGAANATLGAPRLPRVRRLLAVRVPWVISDSPAVYAAVPAGLPRSFAGIRGPRAGHAACTFEQQYGTTLDGFVEGGFSSDDDERWSTARRGRVMVVFVFGTAIWVA